MTRSSTTRVTTTAAMRVQQGDWELTARQVELLKLLSRGLSLRQVAQVMRLSVNSVKTHARRAYARLGANNAAHAVRRGFERGLLRADGEDGGDVTPRPWFDVGESDEDEEEA